MRQIAGFGNVEAEPLFVDSDTLLPIGGARSSHASSDSPRPINVSMVVLLAEPQEYDDKFIRTIGFVCLEYEGDALYLTMSEIIGIKITKTLLRFAARKQFESLSLKQVIVEGTMYANGPKTQNKEIQMGRYGCVRVRQPLLSKV